jgi:hypothetical protein
MKKWLLRVALWFITKYASSTVVESPHGDALLKYAGETVREIEGNGQLREVVRREGNIAFCPRCGQRPSADYRREEAFERIFGRFPEATPAEINFAIEFAHRSLP